MYVVYMEVKCDAVGNDGKPTKVLLARVRVGDSASYDGATELANQCYRESYLESNRLYQIRSILWGMYPGVLGTHFIVSAEK